MDLGQLLGGLDADRIGELVDLLTKNRDTLDQVGRLPDFFEKFAGALGAAGEQAREASYALVGEDGGSGMRATLGDSAEALSDISGSLGKGVSLLKEAAESAAKVPLMDGPAARFAGAAEELGATTGRLGDLATSLGAIAETLEKVGAALGRLGDHLDDSGTQARGFLSA